MKKYTSNNSQTIYKKRAAIHPPTSTNSARILEVSVIFLCHALLDNLGADLFHILLYLNASVF